MTKQAQRVVLTALVIWLASAGVANALPTGTQKPAIESHITLLADGVEPFDATDSGGNDSGANNGVIRNFDLAVFRVVAAVNDADDTNVFTKVVLEGPAKWTSVPLNCLTTAAGFNVTPESEIIDSDGDGLGETLICNFGAATEGSKLAIEPAAQVIGSNGEKVSASVSGDSDNNINHTHPTSEHLSDDIEISAGFGVSIDETVNGLDPINKFNYKPIYVSASKHGREGWLIDWQFDLTYGPGSELIASDNGLQDLEFAVTWTGSHSGCTTPSDPDCSVNSDNEVGEYADGVMLYGEVTGNPGDSCALLVGPGNVECTQNGPGEPLTVKVNDQSVITQPLASVKLKMFYPQDTIFAPNGFATSEVYSVEQYVELIDWGGTDPLLTSGSGANDSGPEFDTENWLLIATLPGGLTFNKTFDGDPDNDKSGARAAARGEIVETTLSIFDWRLSDLDSGICDTLDTESFEFAGAIMPGPGQKDAQAHGVVNLTNEFTGNKMSIHGVSNPGLFADLPGVGGTWAVSEPLGVKVEFSDVDYAASGDDHWSATCEDDLDGDGSYDWVDDYNTLAGGAPSVIRIRVIWDRNFDEFKALTTPDHNPRHVQYSFDLRIKDTAVVGSQLPNTASLFVEGDPRYATWTNPVGGVTAAGNATSSGHFNVNQDPADPLFSYQLNTADRVLVVPASMGVDKKVDNPGPYQPGDEVNFTVDAYTAGSHADDIELELVDHLPAEMELISEDCETVFQAHSATCVTSVSGQSITWTITDYKVGDPLPTINLKARLRNGVASGAFTNTVLISSPFAALSDDSHCDNITIGSNQAAIDRRKMACRLAVGRRMRDQVSVVVVGQIGFKVIKEGDPAGPDVGGEFTFGLEYTSLGGADIEKGRLIDVLPFNGDGDGDDRSHSSGVGGTERHNTDVPTSPFDSTYTTDPLGRAHFVNMSGDYSELKFTTYPSDKMDLRPCHPMHWPQGDTGATSADITDLCHDGLIDPTNDKPALDNAGTGEVPWDSAMPANPSDITAVMADFETLAAGESGKMELTLGVGAAASGNLFCNNFGAHASTLVFDIVSNDVCVQVNGRIYDVALRKTAVSAKVSAGGKANYQIEVFNQGEHAVTDVVISDRLPTGLGLADTGWFDNGGGVISTVVAGPIAPGASVVVPLQVDISDTVTGDLTNVAEVTEMKDETGTVVLDFDSVSDADPDNDVLVDDVIDSCVVCAVPDEDDHDVATITVEPPGTLALTGSNATILTLVVGTILAAVGSVFARRKKRTAVTFADGS